MTRSVVTNRFSTRNYPYSYYMDGSGDFCSLGNNYSITRSDPLSVGAFVKLKAWGSTNMSVIRKASTSPLNGWSFFVDSVLHTTHCYLATTSVGDRILVGTQTAKPMVLNRWYFIGFSYDGSSSTNGINMVLVEVGDPLTSFATKETPITNALTGNIATTVDLRIGASSDSLRTFFGKVHGVFLSTSALTLSDFQSIYYNNSFPSTVNSKWFCEGTEGSGLSVSDEIGSVDGTLNGTTSTAWNTDTAFDDRSVAIGRSTIIRSTI